MLGAMAGLTNELANELKQKNLLDWASPVPYFGKIQSAEVATFGINPSNLEFVDRHGNELSGSSRRLETLKSLGLDSWRYADGDTVRALVRSCSRYFDGNPYRRWFDVLERVLQVSDNSYYGARPTAHLDLVPYATSIKWSALAPEVKRNLIKGGQKTLAEIVSESPVKLLVLNGRSVVDAFIESTGSALKATQVGRLSLPRADGNWVAGYRWDGTVTEFAGRDLGRQVRVVGFNHNLQSSFGVTREVMNNIGHEIGDSLD